MEQIRRIMRPTDVPDTGLLCDLLWSDPDKDVTVSTFYYIQYSIYIQILFLRFRDGAKTTAVYHLPLVPT